MTGEKVKFRLLEKSIKTLQELGLDPLKYEDDKPGIILKNLGDPVEILGRNKFVAFEEKPAVIRTGIEMSLPPGYYSTFCSEPFILGTSLVCRNTIYYGNTEEILVGFLNFGEKDITIPTGATLPVRLMVCKVSDSELVSDLDYLKATSRPNS